MEKKVSDYRKTEGAAFFFIEAAKALGWYREKTGIKLSDIGKQIALSESAVSKYLIAPKLEKNFSNEEDLKKNSKVILTLEYALKISEAMGAKLWNILHMYEKDREEIEKCTNLNASLFTDELNLNNINFITNSNDIKFEPWFGEFFCYFSSTSSSEINECKRESLNGMIEEEKELFDSVGKKTLGYEKLGVLWKP